MVRHWPAASKIRFAVSSGCASIATWLAATSMVLAFIFLAIALSRLGWMARSFVATRYQLGFVALLAYTRQAHLGGFDMLRRPKLRQWVSRCEAELGLAAV